MDGQRNTIPLRRPDPEVQAIKADLVRDRAAAERLEQRVEIAELRAASATQFTSALAWMILALLAAVGIGAWSFLILAVSAYFAVCSLSTARRANEHHKKLR